MLGFSYVSMIYLNSPIHFHSIICHKTLYQYHNFTKYLPLLALLYLPKQKAHIRLLMCSFTNQYNNIIEKFYKHTPYHTFLVAYEVQGAIRMNICRFQPSEFEQDGKDNVFRDACRQMLNHHIKNFFYLLLISFIHYILCGEMGEVDEVRKRYR